jgi:NADH-quinone oxidoreductase subunit N
MTHRDALVILPLLVVAATALVVLVSIAVRRSHRAVVGLTLGGLLVALAAIGVAWPLAPRQVTPLLGIDGFALFYTAVILGAGLAIAALSYGYWRREAGGQEEYYLLLLLGIFGGGVLTASTHLASVFLGLEIISVAIYALAAYVRASAAGTEAGVKYLILAGISSAFLLFGIALIYTELGTMHLAGVIEGSARVGASAVLMTGIAFLFVGMGFKLALFPFYLWTPDVFEGAPMVVAAFIATVSKCAIFAVLLRVFLPLQATNPAGFAPLLAFLAITTMLAGTFLALRQRNLKRLLAYSSITHMGFLLVAFLASSALAVIAITFYLTSYLLAVLGAFGVMAMLSTPERERARLEDYTGLAWQRPGLAAILMLCLLSLAGLPLTAGFMGKFLLAAAAIGAQLWTPVIILILTSAIGLYYYLRVVRELFRRPHESHGQPRALESGRPHWLGGLILVALLLLVVGLGVYPVPLTALIERMLTGGGR